MIHPMEATEIFASEYIEARKRSYARRKDKDRAEFIKVIDHDHFLEGSFNSITGFWKARRKADEIGAPYDFYCAQALKYAERRDWTNMPHPWQLAGEKAKFEDDLSMVEHIALNWHQSKTDAFRYSTLDYYKVENYQGTSHQAQHQIAIINHIKSKPKTIRPMMIADFVWSLKLLNEEAALKAFGERDLKRSLSYRDELY